MGLKVDWLIRLHNRMKVVFYPGRTISINVK
jgi:hypothetical protein